MPSDALCHLDEEAVTDTDARGVCRKNKTPKGHGALVYLPMTMMMILTMRPLEALQTMYPGTFYLFEHSSLAFSFRALVLGAMAWLRNHQLIVHDARAML